MTFSLNNLAIFERPGATIEKREERFHAGCWVRFENGWVVSIQWGCGNYGSNYHRGLGEPPEDATEAEMAAWKGEKGGMVEWLDGDTVQGYCSVERVQHVLDLVAEDKLLREYHPPVEMRADDGWRDGQ